MESKAEKTLFTATQYPAPDVEERCSRRGAWLHNTDYSGLLHDEDPIGPVVRAGQVKRLIQTVSDQRLKVNTDGLRLHHHANNQHNDCTAQSAYWHASDSISVP